MKRVGSAELRELGEAAERSPRRRRNFNLHSSPDDPVQRMLNAFTPGTCVRPHRHSESRWELFALLQGRLAVLFFDDAGRVTERLELGPDGERVIEIPGGAWHSLTALTPGTVVLEIKPGPYRPNGTVDFAPWAPAEEDARAAELERWFRTARVGDVAPR